MIYKKYFWDYHSRATMGSNLAQVVNVMYKVNLYELLLYMNRTNTMSVQIITTDFSFTMSVYDVQDSYFNNQMGDSLYMIKQKYTDLKIIANGVDLRLVYSYINDFTGEIVYINHIENKKIINRCNKVKIEFVH